MKLTLYIQSYQLKTASSWFGNLSAGWFASIFFTQSPTAKLYLIFASIVSLIITLICERILSET